MKKKLLVTFKIKIMQYVLKNSYTVVVQILFYKIQKNCDEIFEIKWLIIVKFINLLKQSINYH